MLQSVSLRSALIAVTCLLAATLLLAILICSLAPSSYMTEIPFIPSWLATWADANPNFRNMPVFAAFAALLFFVFNFFKLQTASRVCETGYRGDQLIPRTLKSALRAAVCASALGAALEALQLLIPGRIADPMDVLWMTLGAFVGAFGAVFAGTRLCAR